MMKRNWAYIVNGNYRNGVWIMSTLQKAIENITHYTKKFPKEDFQIISEYREEALPYLRNALDYAISKGGGLEDDYELHLYALYFLGQFKDTESFERIMELASLPSGILDFLIGDVITENLGDILYHTYNGNLALLKDSVKNTDIDAFARIAMLDVMGQMYLDGTLEREEWQSYLKEIIWDEGETGYEIYTSIVGMVCECHFIEMLPDVRHLFDEDLVDEWVYGKYDSCVDILFEYREKSKRFCKPALSVESLKNWSMFDREEGDETGYPDAEWEKAFEEYEKTHQREPVVSHKIGRNDPCPCGSGKKYKHCCLNKHRNKVEGIESEQEQQKWLKEYPQLGMERVKGRIYLEDYFDRDSIEIDRLVYLALHHRAIPMWEQEMIREDVVDARKRGYLWEAFSRYQEKLQREDMKTAEEYDQKYAIHYRCKEWMQELLFLLGENGEKERCMAVLEYLEK